MNLICNWNNLQPLFKKMGILGYKIIAWDSNLVMTYQKKVALQATLKSYSENRIFMTVNFKVSI